MTAQAGIKDVPTRKVPSGTQMSALRDRVQCSRSGREVPEGYYLDGGCNLVPIGDEGAFEYRGATGHVSN